MTETTHPLPVAPAPAGALGRFLRVAPAHERVRGWQVGPAVDMAALFSAVAQPSSAKVVTEIEFPN